MNIDIVAAQLRANAPLFEGNVAGAARYADAVADQVFLPLPAAYVVPGDDDAGENTSMNGLYQVVTQHVGVIVVLETLKVGATRDLADRRGQAASAYLMTVRGAVFRALLNWRPDWDPENPDTNIEARGLAYAGSELLEFDRARFFYQFNFSLETLITDADGWQQPSTPLIGVQGAITTMADLQFGVTLPKQRR